VHSCLALRSFSYKISSHLEDIFSSSTYGNMLTFFPVIWQLLQKISKKLPSYH
jgi:hypothetical protein